MRVKKLFLIIRGGFRLLFGFCPACNSDAPQMYDCTVCRWNWEPKREWWKRFKDSITDKKITIKKWEGK